VGPVAGARNASYAVNTGTPRVDCGWIGKDWTARETVDSPRANLIVANESKNNSSGSSGPDNTVLKTRGKGDRSSQENCARVRVLHNPKWGAWGWRMDAEPIVSRDCNCDGGSLGDRSPEQRRAMIAVSMHRQKRADGGTKVGAPIGRYLEKVRYP